MLRRLIEVRMLMALAIAAGVGIGGLRAFPIRSDQVFLAVIEARHPGAYDALVYGYAALWFSTPFWIASMIALARHDRRLQDRPCRAVPRTADLPTARDEAIAIARARRSTSRNATGPSARTDMADDPAAWALHRAHGSWSGWDRKDVRMHVPLRGPAPSVAARRCRPQGRRFGDGGEGRFLPAGSRDPEGCAAVVGCELRKVAAICRSVNCQLARRPRTEHLPRSADCSRSREAL